MNIFPAIDNIPHNIKKLQDLYIGPFKICAPFHERAGNQLFEYAVIRSLGEIKGWNWSMYEGGPAKYFKELYPDLPFNNYGKINNEHFPATDKHKKDIYISDSLACDVAIWSGFQDKIDIDILYKNKKSIGDFFAINNLNGFPSKYLWAREFWNAKKDMVCINIRGDGDFKSLGWLPYDDWFEKAQKYTNDKFKINHNYVVIGDSIQYSKEHMPSLEFYHYDAISDFWLLLTAPKLICSNSTFCWWAAFLNEERYILNIDGWFNKYSECFSSVPWEKLPK